MSTVAVIPARGGSKRIPQKNIKPLGGKPLLAYTLEAALGSSRFDRVIVSTDDPAIAALAESLGAEAPFTRAAQLADDHTPSSLVTLDTIERLGLPDDAQVAQLLPNCPFRTAEDVCSSHDHFSASDSKAQLSVTRYGWLNPWWAFTMDERGLEPLFADELKKRSQDLPTLYCPTGAIWWTTAGTLRQEKTFHTEHKTGWELPWQRAIDIDDDDDWQMAEFLLARMAAQ